MTPVAFRQVALLVALVSMAAIVLSKTPAERLRELTRDFPHKQCRNNVAIFVNETLKGLMNALEQENSPRMTGFYPVMYMDCPGVDEPNVQARMFFDSLCKDYDLFVICNTTQLTRLAAMKDADGRPSLNFPFVATARITHELDALPCACTLETKEVIVARGATVPDPEPTPPPAASDVASTTTTA